MAITDPRAIKFVNEQVRPMAEELRALKARVDAFMVDWFTEISTLIPNDSEEQLEDGREAQGVSRLNGEDINGLATVVQSIQSLLETAGYEARIAKPCVRPLQVE